MLSISADFAHFINKKDLKTTIALGLTSIRSIKQIIRT